MKHTSDNSEMNILDFITKNGAGSLSEIERLYDVDTVRRLESIGIIENGLSLTGETWKITDYGRRKASLNRKSSINERCSGFINRHILGFSLRND